MKKDEKLKIILKVSFVPYILFILISLCHCIFGRSSIDFMTTSVPVVYGIEAIEQDLFITIICFWPVFAISLIYQIGYLIFYIKKAKERKENKT